MYLTALTGQNKRWRGGHSRHAYEVNMGGGLIIAERTLLEFVVPCRNRTIDSQLHAFRVCLPDTCIVSVSVALSARPSENVRFGIHFSNGRRSRHIHPSSIFFGW
jgi:hypothetical protein